jgi:hypothetical protein
LGPSTSSSTRPSLRFLTPPQSPRCDAIRAANARYPTPWTFPFTNSLARRVAASIGSAIHSDNPCITTVTVQRRDILIPPQRRHAFCDSSRENVAQRIMDEQWTCWRKFDACRHGTTTPAYVRMGLASNCWGECSGPHDERNGIRVDTPGVITRWT